MTDASSRKRQPRGTTTGGQFATESRSEASVSLDAPRTLRSADIREGFDINDHLTVERINARGEGFVIGEVSGNGRSYSERSMMYLEEGINDLVPRAYANKDGWYVGQEEYAAPMFFSPETFADALDQDAEEIQRDAKRVLMSHNPALLTRETGELFSSGQLTQYNWKEGLGTLSDDNGSYRLRKNNPDTLFIQGWDARKPNDLEIQPPEGFVIARARNLYDSESDTFLVPIKDVEVGELYNLRHRVPQSAIAFDPYPAQDPSPEFLYPGQERALAEGVELDLSGAKDSVAREAQSKYLDRRTFISRIASSVDGRIQHTLHTKSGQSVVVTREMYEAAGNLPRTGVEELNRAQVALERARKAELDAEYKFMPNEDDRGDVMLAARAKTEAARALLKGIEDRNAQAYKAHLEGPYKQWVERQNERLRTLVTE